MSELNPNDGLTIVDHPDQRISEESAVLYNKILPWPYEELKWKLKQNGSIPTCGYPFEKPVLFLNCTQEVIKKGERCYFHKKREAVLI